MKITNALILLFLCFSLLASAQYNSALNSSFDDETVYEISSGSCDPLYRIQAGIRKNVVTGFDQLIWGKTDKDGIVVGNWFNFPSLPSSFLQFKIHPNVEMTSYYDPVSGQCSGYIIVISYEINNSGIYNLGLIKTDLSGQVIEILNPLPTNNASEYCNAIIQDQNFNLILAGAIEYSGQKHVLIQRISSDFLNVQNEIHSYTAADGSLLISQANDIKEIIPNGNGAKYVLVGKLGPNSLISTVKSNLEAHLSKSFNIDDNLSTEEEAIAVEINAASFNVVGTGREDIGFPSNLRYTYFSRFSALLSFNPLAFNDLQQYWINSEANYPTDMEINIAGDGYIICGAAEVCEFNCTGDQQSPVLMEADLFGTLSTAILHKGVMQGTNGHGVLYDIEKDSTFYPFAGKLWENASAPNYEYQLGEADVFLMTGEDCFSLAGVESNHLSPHVQDVFPIHLPPVDSPIFVDKFTQNFIPEQIFCEDLCCSTDMNDFCNKVMNGYTLTVLDCDVSIVYQLDTCHIIHIDWGDGNVGTYPYNGVIQHTYANTGAYTIMVTVDEFDAHMSLCYTKTFPIEIFVDCDEDCPIDCQGIEFQDNGFAFIFDMVAWNGTIIAVGQHNVTSSSNVAYWDLCTNQWMPMGTGLNGTAFTVEVFQNEIYVGGEFTHNGANTVSLQGIAKWDDNISVWTSIGGVQKTGFVTGTVYDLMSLGNRLIVGGDFDATNNITNPLMMNVAEWDNSNSWNSVCTVNPLLNNERVTSLGYYQNKVVVGGCFSEGILSINPIGPWSSFNFGLDISQNCGTIGGGVNAIHADGNDLYVGGAFQGAYNQVSPAVTNSQIMAKWDGSQWISIGNIDPANSIVWDIMEIDQCGLLIAGALKTINSNVLVEEGLVYYNNGTWTDLNTLPGIYHTLEIEENPCTGECHLFAAGEAPFLQSKDNPCDSLDWSGFDITMDTICSGNLTYDLTLTPGFGSVIPDWIEYDFECNVTVDIIDVNLTTVTFYPPTAGIYQVCATAYKIIGQDTCTYDWMDIIEIEECPIMETECCENIVWNVENSTFDTEQFIEFNGEVFGQMVINGTPDIWSYDGTNFTATGANSVNPDWEQIVVHQGDLYFSNHRFVYKFTNPGWQQIGEFDYSPGTSIVLLKLSSSSLGLMVAGRFDTELSTTGTLENLCYYDGSNWLTLPNTPGSSYLSTATELGNEVLITGKFNSGRFTHVYDIPNQSWSNPTEDITTALVYSAITHNGQIILGGDFEFRDNSGNLIQRNICAYDNNGFQQIGNNWVEGQTLALYSYGGVLYASGAFHNFINSPFLTAQMICGTDWEDLHYVSNVGQGRGIIHFQNDIFHVVSNTTSQILYQTDCELTSSVDNERIELEWELFPNPSKDLLNIKTPGLKNYHIEILDITGKRIFKGNDQYNLDVSLWKAGIYIVQLSNNVGLIGSKKFVKI